MGGGGQAGGRRVLPVAPHGSDLSDRTAGGAAANRASDKNPAEKKRLPLWKENLITSLQPLALFRAEK